MTNKAKVLVNWQGLEYRPFVITDILFPGAYFGQSLPDDRLNFYEVEKQFFEDNEDEWSATEIVNAPQLRVEANFERAVRVRIRAVLRDGGKTPWVYSVWFALYGFEASFANYRNNSIFLGVI
jgi:hypothetical protein